MSRTKIERRNGTKTMQYNSHIYKGNSQLKSSKQLDETEYSYGIIPPLYEPRELIRITERNDTLKQNIGALATNIADFGHAIRFQSDFDYSNKNKLKDAADKEWNTLRRLYKNINALCDLSTLIHNVAIDMHTFGWGMLEVIRDTIGRVCSFEYCRACNFRIVKNDNPITSIKTWEETENGYEQIENHIKFKKFVQIINGNKIYFKEFGDPRQMNCITGDYEENTPQNEIATEIAYFCVHSSYTDYGIPQWINTSITASGNIQSELLNNKYFSDGMILPMAITVSGGQLTEDSAEIIKQGKGIDNAYKMMILEAAPFEVSEEQSFTQRGANPQVSIDVKSLTDTNNSDALFKEYQKDGKEKIRDSFRLPPIYTGASSDYNRATADTARHIAEEQIFIPERKRICSVLNKIINNELGIKYCELYLKGPEISDTDQKANILNVLNQSGAITPNMLIPIINTVLGKEVEPWNNELGNIPFELTKMKMQTELTQNTGTEDMLQKSDEEINEISRLIDIIETELEEGIADD